MKIGSIFVPVSDLNHSADWYESRLDLKRIGEWEGGIGYALPDGSAQLALVRTKTQQGTEFFVDEKERHVFFNLLVTDARDLHLKLSTRAVVTTPIKEANGMKYFDFFDLDGNTFSVVEEDPDSPFYQDHLEENPNK
ncbi:MULTISPECIES: VOC family protein [Bhargavaea]|uniref:VOC family protein n=1 Tax=Bhargavaea changchunensis TaxID=2134037 RepID=A0ABW2NI59_9BACL|nr:VOC family protein [Bhargavaea sp. CC-171006]